MKLVPAFDTGVRDEVIFTVAELGEVRAYLAALIAQRDHARSWAAFHQADATWDRERLVRLVEQRAIPWAAVPQPECEEPVPPVGLAEEASDGWHGWPALMR